MKRGYDTDLTGEQWRVIQPLVEAKRGRSAQVSRREIVNAILYVARTGCQWRNLPHDFPNEHGLLVLPPLGMEWAIGSNPHPVAGQSPQ